MGIDPIIFVAAALAFLTAVTVTQILLLLASMRKHQIEMHDLVRNSKRLRNEYIEAVTQRRAMAQGGVEMES